MRALGSFIVIKPEKVEEQVSASGLLMTAADSNSFKYHEAIVLLVGDSKDVKVGDKIAFDKNAGHPYKLDGEMVRIIQERDCALILDTPSK